MCQEPNQPLKILGCGRQVELLRDIPEPPQTYATKSDTQLEFGEQCLDLVPFAFRAGIRGSLRQLSGRLPCRFMPVNEEPPSRSASATLLYGAASTLRLRGLINVTLCLAWVLYSGHHELGNVRFAWLVSRKACHADFWRHTASPF